MKTFLSCVLLLAAAAPGQTPVPPAEQKPAEAKAQDPQSVLDQVQKQFQKEGIVVDAKAQTVTVPAVVNDPRDAVEYLLIHRRGKRHEAIFWTNSKPSVLNAALLMLGMMPGQNATYTEKQPPPSLEEIEKGADPLVVVPPKGTPFWMTVKWKGEDGKEVEHCIEDMVLDLGTQKPIADCSWVYLGGRMAKIYKDDPEVYVADFEGNLVSVCYLSPDNHLGTMVHENARDDQNWWTTALVPKAETEVQFVFHKNQPVLHQERAARLLREKKAAEAVPAEGGNKGGG